MWSIFMWFMWSKIHFPPFGPFWSVKYLNFGQKLPIWTVNYTFLKGRHPEVSKTPYYVMSPEGSQEKVSAYGLQEARTF